ncbi:MFS transporter [Brachybacterium huguangmaarense]|uniref:MFS transporter n=1 Tax=Brachybacterium huguangmaarense TaxID=1652028 RepID=A0ABY6G152_9MICO|nr:MFS transporter [Brachybacterium huguangmaarense]UYG16704.1 MFS transporter [Brachybacterium huguangmaarense]
MSSLSAPAPVTADRPTPTDRRARWAVSLVFFLNGISFCAILPRYPELRANLDLSYGQFGLAIGLGPLGGLVAGLGAAALMRRFGSGRTAVLFQVVASTCHLLIYTAQSWAWLAGALLLATAADAITDISMNAHGMRVERRYGRSIMNSYHGWWSLGAVAGGLLGAACAQFAVPLWAQGIAGLVVFGAVALGSARSMLTGHDQSEREALAAGASAASANDAAVAPPAGGRLSAWKLSGRAVGMLLALGMVLVFAGATEDAGNTWGAQFMDSTFGVSPFVAGMAFVALQGAQTIGRFTGDAVVDRLGDRMTARLGALLSIAGMSLALLAPHPATAMIGFACAGWGIATLFPAAFRAADELPGVTPGVGITLVGWLARIGFFLAPPVVGALADAFTLRYALWLMPIYAVMILLFSGVLETRRVRNG